MKKLITLLLIAVTLSACKKDCANTICYNGGDCLDNTCHCAPGWTGKNCETSTNGGGGGGGTKYGNAVFWYDSYGTEATVYVSGSTGYITAYYNSYDPTCGSSGCANFYLPVGSYSFSASSSFSNWSGNVTITENGCSKVLLN